MKKLLLAGLLVGLVSFGVISVLASDAIVIMVNGTPLECDVNPMIINGKTMVPLSTVAQALGCYVDWDANTRTVSITSPSGQSSSFITASTPPRLGLDRGNPVPLKQTFTTPDGLEITVESVSRGSQAWSILYEANMYNKEPEKDYEYIVATVKVKNVNPSSSSIRIHKFDFSIVGSSNKVIEQDFIHVSTLAPGGSHLPLEAELFTNGEETGSMGFYIPASESNLQLIYSKSGVPKVFFSLQ